MGNLISHAFGPCGLNKLHGPIIASNAAAISSYLKSGFKIEGYLRQHCLKDGEYHDLVLVGLVKSDWSEANIIKAEIDG
jgi:RimJ/RimL family protein N-acetyltransferase